MQKGHSVTVISSKTKKQKDIDALGAKPAIGLIDDVPFLTETFAGADIVYLMEPHFLFGIRRLSQTDNHSFLSSATRSFRPFD